MSQVKVYELLPHMNPTAPIFTQISPDQRIRHNRRPSWRPFLQYTVLRINPKTGLDENVTLRLKLNSNTIIQEEQIKNGIPANTKLTSRERTLPTFRFGTLVATHPTLQLFLESIPDFEGFMGDRGEYGEPKFRLVDKEAETKAENTFIRKQVKAANKVLAIEDYEEAKTLFIGVFGVSSLVPSKLEDIQNDLINHINEEEGGANDILADRSNLDDKVKLLVGKAVDAGILSFDAEGGKVSLKRNGNWVAVKNISIEYRPEERVARFVEYLSSEEGKLLREDIQNDLSKTAKSSSSDGENGGQVNNRAAAVGSTETGYTKPASSVKGAGKRKLTNK